MKKHLFFMAYLFWLSIATSLLYYFLIEDNTFHLSISDILAYANHFTKHGHIFVIGFLPIYLGLIIFGAAVLLTYFRSKCLSLYRYLSACLNFKRKI